MISSVRNRGTEPLYNIQYSLTTCVNPQVPGSSPGGGAMLSLFCVNKHVRHAVEHLLRIAQFGGALALGARGRRFKSYYGDHTILSYII